ncbi:MAG TPA: nitrilase-related carbon-nitrogen hydrolase [Armatimonadota bacterium]|jgi:apolipoprotein N-acyltransferase
METTPPRILPIVAAAVAVALFTTAFQVRGCGALVWLAFVPLLVILPRASQSGAQAIGFAAGFAAYAIGFRWFAHLFGAPAVVLWSLLALFVTVFCELVRSLPMKMPAWQRALLAGCFWVALEYIRCEQWPLRFSWLAPGYAFRESLVGLRAASWIGVYGLSFAIVTMAAGAAWSRKRVAAGFLLLAIAVAAIPVRPSARHGAAQGGRVVLVQSSSTSRASLLQMGDKALAGAPKPTLLVWPEYVIQFTEEETPDAYAALRRAAHARGVTLVYGGLRAHGQSQDSAAYVVGPDGKSLGCYEKHNPLPFFKDGEPGAAYPVFHWRVADGDAPFGVTICYDLSFERNARRLAGNGARFLVVPSMEPEDWPRVEQYEHAMAAPLRAAENGVGIVRCSTPGPSQIVDAHGAVLLSQPAGQWGALTWDGAPPMGSGQRTPYNRAGWLLPYLCQFVTVCYIACRFVAARRSDGVKPSGPAISGGSRRCRQP